MKKLFTAIFFTVLLSGCELEDIFEQLDQSDECCCVLKSGYKFWTDSKSCNDSEQTAVCVPRKDGGKKLCESYSNQSSYLFRNEITKHNNFKLLVSESNISTNKIQKSIDNCIDECKEGPFCLKAEIVNDGISKGLSKSYSIINDTNIWRYDKAMMMNDFNVNEDPCNRTDVFRNNDMILNLGDECYLHVPVENSNFEMSIDLKIPRFITAQESLEKGWKKYIFSVNSLSSPHIEFSNEDYQTEYGGLIKSILFSKKTIIAESQNACLMISYK